MPRPPGHSARFEPRREEIIDQAAALFAENGYAATGITELGAAVGLGRGALYYYIESKEHLLVAIQDRVLGPLLEQAAHIIGLGARPVVRLRLLSETLLSLILARADHIRVYEHDYRHLTGDNLKRVVDQRHEFERLVQSLVQEMIDDGTLRQVDPRLAALQFLNLHNHTYQWAETANRKWGVDGLSVEYCRTLLHGMAASDLSFDELEAEVDRCRPLVAGSD